MITGGVVAFVAARLLLDDAGIDGLDGLHPTNPRVILIAIHVAARDRSILNAIPSCSNYETEIVRSL